jgi:hypothetical protein
VHRGQPVHGMNFERLSRISRQTTVRDPPNKLQDIIHRVLCEIFNRNNDLRKFCLNIGQIKGQWTGLKNSQWTAVCFGQEKTRKASSHAGCRGFCEFKNLRFRDLKNQRRILTSRILSENALQTTCFLLANKLQDTLSAWSARPYNVYV